MENPQQNNSGDKAIFELLKSERIDSAKERRQSQSAFLKAIEQQTAAQTEAMNNLGDRLEASLLDMRKDLRGATSRTFYLIGLAILVVAALGGVSVSYVDGKLELLQPQADSVRSMEEPKSGDK